MKLTPVQLEQFDREGYLFFPSMFSEAEMQVLVDCYKCFENDRQYHR